MQIGDISKILDMKPETIRYYEKAGIVSPRRKPDSTFREYSFWDFLDLCACRQFRQMDFSVNDTRSLMKEENLSDIVKALTKKYSEIYAGASQKRILAAEVRSLAERIRNAPLNIGNYWFCTDEEKVGIHLTERNGSQYTDVDVNSRELQAWLSDLPYIRGYMNVLVDDILMKRDRNEWFFCTDLNHFRMLQLPEKNSFHIPRQVCLHTVLDIGEKGSLSLTMLEPILDHIRGKGLAIDTHIIGEILVSCYEGKTFHRYVEIMVSVKSKNEEK